MTENAPEPTAAQTPPPTPASQAAAPRATPPDPAAVEAARRRNPALAGFLSLILPGFGNIYNGLFQRALAIFATVFGLFFVTTSVDEGPVLALLIPSMVFVWLFGVFDSYRQATLINFGLTQDDLDVLPARDSGGIVAGVVFFVIGLLGLLHEVFGFDLSMLFDHWYLLLMAFGAWLAWQGWRSRQEASNTESDSLEAI